MHSEQVQPIVSLHENC